MLLALILVLGAVWSFFIAARPEVGFFLEEGWKFRDAEPSDLYLGVTRIGAALGGVALLIFAAVLALNDPGDKTSSPAERTDSSPTGSVPPITVTARPPDPEQEAKKRAKEHCRDLLPYIEDASEWDSKGRLANPDRIALAVTEHLATMTIVPKPGGDVITIRSDLPNVDNFIRPVITMTSSKATCLAD